MDKLHELRKEYFKISREFVQELDRGIPIEQLRHLKEQIDRLIATINEIEDKRNPHRNTILD